MSALLELAAKLNAEVLLNEPMSRHTTFNIGGPAEYLITPADADSVCELLAFCAGNDLGYLILGNGSNLLVSDSGFKGAVISIKKINTITSNGDEIICGAGAPLSEVCRFAAANGLAGLEFAYGIPGTVGGAVYMNAGAYGGEMKDVVTAVSHCGSGGPGELSGGELCFGYRKSAYSGTGEVITSVRIGLNPGDRAGIDAKMQQILGRRKKNQPLEYPSAGSVFKRPEGHYAGTLIESCGLKGLRCGGAMVSEKHAGFIVNTGGATCSDVLSLIERIKSEVLVKTGVGLECEIKQIV